MGQGGTSWSSTFLCLFLYLHPCPQSLIFFLLSEKVEYRQSFRAVIALKPDIIKTSFITISESIMTMNRIDTFSLYNHNKR